MTLNIEILRKYENSSLFQFDGLIFLKCYTDIVKFFSEEFKLMKQAHINPASYPNGPTFKIPIFMTYLYQILDVIMKLQKDNNKILFGLFLDKFLGFLFYYKQNPHSEFRCQFIPYLKKCIMPADEKLPETKFLKFYKFNWLGRIYDDLKKVRDKEHKLVKIQHKGNLVNRPFNLGINIVYNWYTYIKKTGIKPGTNAETLLTCYKNSGECNICKITK